MASGLGADLPPWVSLVSSALPAGLAPRICEVNTNDGTFAAALRRQWPASTFFGLAFHDEDRQERKALVARVTATWGADAVIYFGDTLRTVRAAPPLDDCDVMIVDTHDAATGARMAIEADLPNVLQRMAIARGRGSVLIMHGTMKRAKWVSAWDELVQRRLVSSVGCAKSWCVGRVDTDSSCLRRPPLLPAALTLQPAIRARSARGRAHAAASREAGAVADTQGTPATPAVSSAAGAASSATIAALAAAGWHSEEVSGLRLGMWWRYFTVLQGCSREPPAVGAPAPPPSHVCLIFKNHVFESWVGGVASTDSGRSFDAEPSLVLPATWATARMTHNLAIASTDAGAGAGGGSGGGYRYLIIGGQFKLAGAARCGRRSGHEVPCYPSKAALPPYNGLWTARGRSWRYTAPGTAPISTGAGGEELARASTSVPTQWLEARWLFNGTHAGCVERRSRFYASMAHLRTCEFDGRLSLVRFGHRLLLYARTNPATHGQRYVQMTASDDGGRTWGRFSFISIGEYDYAQGDVYFFVVMSNPAHAGSLLALFPLAHKFHGCIGLAASTDGMHWSAPTPLLRCAVHGERAVHHPAQGLVVEGSSVAFYVHENVAGITSDHTPTAMQMVAFPYLKLPRPRLMRHTVPLEALRSWTLSALRPENMSTGPLPT